MKFSILAITAKTPVIMEPAEMLVLAQELYAKTGTTVPADIKIPELIIMLGNMLTIIEAVDEEAEAVIC
jgi:hypothetical protein